MRRRATTVDLADYGCEKALTNSSLNFQETLAALRRTLSLQRLQRDRNFGFTFYVEGRIVKGRWPHESAGIVAETILFARNTEEIVIQTIVQVGVVEYADGIGPGCDLVAIGNGARFNIFDSALRDARRRPLFAAVGFESSGAVINRDVDLARIFDVVDRDNEFICQRRTCGENHRSGQLSKAKRIVYWSVHFADNPAW